MKFYFFVSHKKIRFRTESILIQIVVENAHNNYLSTYAPQIMDYNVNETPEHNVMQLACIFLTIFIKIFKMTKRVSEKNYI